MELKEFFELFTESRMKYAHLTILFLYGLVAVFLIGPFVGLFFSPPQDPVDLADLGPLYWKRLISSNAPGLVFYVVIAFNAGLLLSSAQVLAKRGYWRYVIKPIAKLLGRGHDCAIIERQLVTSTRFEDKVEYAEFLHWLGQNPHKQRVRSWDWFMSNAMRTFSQLLFLFALLNVIAALATLLWSFAGPTALLVTGRSWLLIAATAVVIVLLVPGDIHHYRVRAEGDELLYREFLSLKGTGMDPGPTAGQKSASGP